MRLTFIVFVSQVHLRATPSCDAVNVGGEYQDWTCAPFEFSGLSSLCGIGQYVMALLR